MYKITNLCLPIFLVRATTCLRKLVTDLIFILFHIFFNGIELFHSIGDLTVSKESNVKCYKYYKFLYLKANLTRMTTFIKTTLNNSDDQTNIHKYREAANIIENDIKIKLP